VKIVFANLVLPKFTALLSRVKLGTLQSQVILQDQKNQAQAAFIFGIISTLLAPMV
jgi:hypothetical protein